MANPSRRVHIISLNETEAVRDGGSLLLPQR